MNNLKISIVTIAYNCESEIEGTILSVINQTYHNKEYLLIDGGSTDGTMDIVEKYKDKIDIVVSEPDKGISDAFNKGIKIATGDYIVMINAGDLLTNNALDKFVAAYVPGYDVIKGNTIRWNTETKFKSVEYPIIKYSTIPFNFGVNHQSTYISRKAYMRFGRYDVSMRIAMDFELMLRFTRQGATFRCINEELSVFSMGGISQTISQKRYDEMIYAMRKNGRSKWQCYIFLIYLRMRTTIRNILDKVNPDIKNVLVSKVK